MNENESKQTDVPETGLNVLIVDDSVVARTMITRTLRMVGLHIAGIHEAANGQEALAIIRESWIDLVLADINMPVMNGDEMIECLLTDLAWPPTPIVVISTDGSRPRMERLLSRGVRYLRKPFEPEALREIIIEALEAVDVQPT